MQVVVAFLLLSLLFSLSLSLSLSLSVCLFALLLTNTCLAIRLTGNGEPYNHKVDIWALGVTLYNLCTLKQPFDGNTIKVSTSISLPLPLSLSPSSSLSLSVCLPQLQLTSLSALPNDQRL